MSSNNLFSFPKPAASQTSQSPQTSQPPQSSATNAPATSTAPSFGFGGNGTFGAGSTGGSLNLTGTPKPLSFGLNLPSAGSTTPAPAKTSNFLLNSTTPAGTPAPSLFPLAKPATSASTTTSTNSSGLSNMFKPSTPQATFSFGGSPATNSGTSTINPSSSAQNPATTSTAPSSIFSKPAPPPVPTASTPGSSAPASTSTTANAQPSPFGFGGLGNSGTGGRILGGGGGNNSGLGGSGTSGAIGGGGLSGPGNNGTTGGIGGGGGGPGNNGTAGGVGGGGSGGGGGGSGGGGGVSGGSAPGAVADTKKAADAPKTPGLGASNTGPTPQQSRLKNKTMDEIITRWATDLSKYQKDFQDQATTVASWDRLLVENGEKIQKLYSGAFEAERATKEVEAQLSLVEGQQGEIEDWLDRYEKDVDEMFQHQVGDQLQGADQERERVYKLAEKMSEKLTEMGADLKQMIGEINEAQAALNKTNKPDNPLSSIVRTLNGHLSQLQWIDTTSAALQKKITAQKQQAQMNHGGMLGGGGGGGGDTADEFYRSWRRQ